MKAEQPLNTNDATSRPMFAKPKGTIDHYPDELSKLNTILGKFHDVASRYGFRAIETPVFEELKVLTEKEGEQTKEEIFMLEQRGDEKFGLRFDMTVPSARMFTAIQKSCQKPVKWCYGTKNWRYERPQKGRLREFHQFGVELFGSDSPDADAEVINVAIGCLRSLGLTNKDFTVEINNRKLLQGIVSDFVTSAQIGEAIAAIDKRKKLEDKEFFELLKSVGVNDPSKVVEILDLPDLDSIGKLKLNAMAKEGYEELKAVFRLLERDYCKVYLPLARGLSYYTSTVFEIFDVEGKYRALAGGGRYDTMIGNFGGEPCPATGMAIGLTPVQLVLEDKDLMPAAGGQPEVYVAVVDDTVRDKAREIVSALRQSQRVEWDLTGRALGKQMQFASTIGAKKVVIVGPKDVTAGKVTVRDLSSGKEEAVMIESIIGGKKAEGKGYKTAPNRHPPRSKRSK